MAIPKRLTLSYYIDQNKIITPVNLYSIPYNASLTLSTDALWDTGASISAITPAIMNKLKVTPVDKKTIAGIHSTQTVDIVYIIVELPNGNSQTLFSFAAPPFKEKIDFSKRQNEE